jgi:hypothetical protein
MSASESEPLRLRSGGVLLPDDAGALTSVSAEVCGVKRVSGPRRGVSSSCAAGALS